MSEDSCSRAEGCPDLIRSAYGLRFLRAEPASLYNQGEMTAAMKTCIPHCGLEIRPVGDGELEAILNVYRQCEDFLALGPVATASVEMVMQDVQSSRKRGGLFCGVYDVDRLMIGILDYVPHHYDGNPSQASLELLMIAAPFRGRGIGEAVVQAVENEIRKDAAVTTILSGVQVNNPLAVKFWQKNGYCISSGPELMPDHTAVFRLRKDL